MKKYPYSVDVTYLISDHGEKFDQTHYTIFWHSDYRNTPAFFMELD
jgi:hypothetical protein